MLDLKADSARLKALSERHHLAVDPEARVDSLPIGVQQRVEILKLLYRDARLLVLDEPTAVLTAPEKDRLFDVLRSLRAEGRSIVIVTHKLHEIMELADRVTIMRDGRVVGTVATAGSSANELARLMVGRDVNLHAQKQPVQRGESLLRIRDLCVRDATGQQKVRGVTLDIHAGEILGIAGVDGNGQSQLAEAILNLRPSESGQVLIDGKDVTQLGVAERRALGLGYVPADRRGVGSVTSLSITDNLILGSQGSRTRRGFLDRPAIRAFARMVVTRFGVRGAGIDTAAGKLSGGNLQKVILAREILRGSKVLVVEQPTRGLDVGAIEAIWKELLRERASGTAILLISAELEELMNLADRIAVIFNGQIAGIVDANHADVAVLGAMMAGGVDLTFGVKAE
jgi:simple sugar transport system ATP-binding protein